MVAPIGPQIRVNVDSSSFTQQAREIGLPLYKKKKDAGKDCVAIFLKQDPKATFYASRTDLAQTAVKYLSLGDFPDNVLDDEREVVHDAISKNFSPEEGNRLKEIKQKLAQIVDKKLKGVRQKIDDAIQDAQRTGKPVEKTAYDEKALALEALNSLDSDERALLGRYEVIIAANLPERIRNLSAAREKVGAEVHAMLAEELALDQTAESMVEEEIEKRIKEFSDKEIDRRNIAIQLRNDITTLRSDSQKGDKKEIPELIAKAETFAMNAEQNALKAKNELEAVEKEYRNPAKVAELKNNLKKQLKRQIGEIKKKLEADVKSKADDLGEKWANKFFQNEKSIFNQMANVSVGHWLFDKSNYYNKVMKEAIKGHVDVSSDIALMEKRFNAYLEKPHQMERLEQLFVDVAGRKSSPLRSSEKIEAHTTPVEQLKAYKPLSRAEAFERGIRAEKAQTEPASKDRIETLRLKNEEFLKELTPEERREMINLFHLGIGQSFTSPELLPKRSQFATEEQYKNALEMAHEEVQSAARRVYGDRVDEFFQTENLKKNKDLMVRARQFLADNIQAYERDDLVPTYQERGAYENEKGDVVFLGSTLKKVDKPKEFTEADTKIVVSILSTALPNIPSSAAAAAVTKANLGDLIDTKHSHAMEVDTKAAFASKKPLKASEIVISAATEKEESLDLETTKTFLEAQRHYNPKEMRKLMEARKAQEAIFEASLKFVTDQEVNAESRNTFPKDLQTFLADSEKVHAHSYPDTAVGRKEKLKDAETLQTDAAKLQERAGAYYLYLLRKQKESPTQELEEQIERVKDQAILLTEGVESIVTQTDLDVSREGLERLRLKDLPGYSEMQVIRQLIASRQPNQKLWYDEDANVFKSGRENPSPSFEEATPEQIQERLGEAWFKLGSGKLLTSDKQLLDVINAGGKEAWKAVQEQWAWPKRIPPSIMAKCEEWLKRSPTVRKGESVFNLKEIQSKIPENVNSFVKKNRDEAVALYMQLRTLIGAAIPDSRDPFDYRAAKYLAEQLENAFNREK